LRRRQWQDSTRLPQRYSRVLVPLCVINNIQRTNKIVLKEAYGSDKGIKSCVFVGIINGGSCINL